MPYRPPTKRELRQAWLGSLSANTEVDDFRESGVANSMVGSGASLLEKAHQRIESGRSAFFGVASGADLDEVCAQHPGFTPRLGPTASVGSVMQFVRSGTAGALQVAAGIIVSSEDDDNVRFITTEPFTFQDGEDTYPADGGPGVRIRCLVRGAIGNVAGGTLTRVISAPAAIIGCTNLEALDNGWTRESDDSLMLRRQDYIRGLQGYTDAYFEYLAKSFVSDEGTRIVHAKAKTHPTIPGLVEIMVDDGGGYIGSTAVADESSGVTPENGQRVFWFRGPAASDPLVTYDGVEYPISGAAAKANFVIKHELGEGYLLPDATLFQTPDAAWSVGGHRIFVGAPAEFQALINGRMSDPLAYPGKRLSGIRVRVRTPFVELVAFRIRLTVDGGGQGQDYFNRVLQRVRDAIVRFLRALPFEEPLRLFDLIDAVHDVEGVRNFVIVTPSADVHPGSRARLSTRGNLITLEAG